MIQLSSTFQWEPTTCPFSKLRDVSHSVFVTGSTASGKTLLTRGWMQDYITHHSEATLLAATLRHEEDLLLNQNPGFLAVGVKQTISQLDRFLALIQSRRATSDFSQFAPAWLIFPDFSPRSLSSYHQQEVLRRIRDTLRFGREVGANLWIASQESISSIYSLLLANSSFVQTTDIRQIPVSFCVVNRNHAQLSGSDSISQVIQSLSNISPALKKKISKNWEELKNCPSYQDGSQSAVLRFSSSSGGLVAVPDLREVVLTPDQIERQRLNLEKIPSLVC